MSPKDKTPTAVRAWTDPSCPWAWEAAKWLLALRDRGVITLTWSLFSLEINAAPPDTPFATAAPRHGASLAALALARREGDQPLFEQLYVALCTLLHEDRRDITTDLLANAAAEVGVPDIPQRASSRLDLEEEITREYADARRLDVFGVPTLQIEGDRVVYGPIVAAGPTGADALALWEDVRRFSGREDLFELKRWPRHLRPGHMRSTAPGDRPR
jgi:predicted DsbA family dithiol-disulfide isomerase